MTPTTNEALARTARDLQRSSIHNYENIYYALAVASSSGIELDEAVRLFHAGDSTLGDGPHLLLSVARERARAEIYNVFDIPPWLRPGGPARPRFARLRWALRRLWPITRKRL